MSKFVSFICFFFFFFYSRRNRTCLARTAFVISSPYDGRCREPCVSSSFLSSFSRWTFSREKRDIFIRFVPVNCANSGDDGFVFFVNIISTYTRVSCISSSIIVYYARYILREKLLPEHRIKYYYYTITVTSTTITATTISSRFGFRNATTRSLQYWCRRI